MVSTEGERQVNPGEGPAQSEATTPRVSALAPELARDLAAFTSNVIPFEDQQRILLQVVQLRRAVASEALGTRFRTYVNETLQQAESLIRNTIANDIVFNLEIATQNIRNGIDVEANRATAAENVRRIQILLEAAQQVWPNFEITPDILARYHAALTFLGVDPQNINLSHLVSESEPADPVAEQLKQIIEQVAERLNQMQGRVLLEADVQQLHQLIRQLQQPEMVRFADQLPQYTEVLTQARELLHTETVRFITLHIRGIDSRYEQYLSNVNPTLALEAIRYDIETIEAELATVRTTLPDFQLPAEALNEYHDLLVNLNLDPNNLDLSKLGYKETAAKEVVLPDTVRSALEAIRDAELVIKSDTVIAQFDQLTRAYTTWQPVADFLRTTDIATLTQEDQAEIRQQQNRLQMERGLLRIQMQTRIQTIAAALRTAPDNQQMRGEFARLIQLAQNTTNPIFENFQWDDSTQRAIEEVQNQPEIDQETVNQITTARFVLNTLENLNDPDNVSLRTRFDPTAPITITLPANTGAQQPWRATNFRQALDQVEEIINGLPAGFAPAEVAELRQILASLQGVAPRTQSERDQRQEETADFSDRLTELMNLVQALEAENIDLNTLDPDEVIVRNVLWQGRMQPLPLEVIAQYATERLAELEGQALTPETQDHLRELRSRLEAAQRGAAFNRRETQQSDPEIEATILSLIDDLNRLNGAVIIRERQAPNRLNTPITIEFRLNGTPTRVRFPTLLAAVDAGLSRLDAIEQELQQRGYQSENVTAQLSVVRSRLRATRQSLIDKGGKNGEELSAEEEKDLKTVEDFIRSVQQARSAALEQDINQTPRYDFRFEQITLSNLPFLEFMFVLQNTLQRTESAYSRLVSPQAVAQTAQYQEMRNLYNDLQAFAELFRSLTVIRDLGGDSDYVFRSIDNISRRVDTVRDRALREKLIQLISELSSRVAFAGAGGPPPPPEDGRDQDARSEFEKFSQQARLWHQQTGEAMVRVRAVPRGEELPVDLVSAIQNHLAFFNSVLQPAIENMTLTLALDANQAAALEKLEKLLLKRVRDLEEALQWNSQRVESKRVNNELNVQLNELEVLLQRIEGELATPNFDPTAATIAVPNRPRPLTPADALQFYVDLLETDEFKNAAEHQIRRRELIRRAQELRAQLKERSVSTADKKTRDEFSDWKNNVEPLRIKILAVERLDRKKVKPHSESAEAKDTAQLVQYQTELTDIYAVIYTAGYLADSPNNLITTELQELVGRDKVSGRYKAAQDKIYEMVEYSRQKLNLRKIDPNDMSLEQLVQAMEGIMTENSPWANAVKNRFIYEKGTEKDPYKFAENHLRAIMPQVMLAGDSEKPDWAADYNKVLDPLISNGITFENLLVYIFMKPRVPGQPATAEDVIQNRLPIDTRAMDLWNYIVKRIRDKYDGITVPVTENGGVYQDNTGGLIPQRQGETTQEYQERLRKIKEIEDRQVAERGADRFGYNGLKGEHAIRNFEEQLILIFGGENDISEEKLKILINFFKHFGAKSAGYMPWLMRATTRGHGFATSNRGEKVDESDFINNEALSLYNALRYRNLKLGRFMSVFRYVKRERFVKIVSESSKDKKHSAEMAWDLMVAYDHAKWEGVTPQWMLNARELFEGNPPEIKLDGTIYPPLPEMIGNIAMVEHEKRQILAAYETVPGSGQYDTSRRINGLTFEERVAQFVNRYQKRGYAGAFNPDDPPEKKLAAFGANKITDLQTDPTHLDLAQKAVSKMFKFFEDPLPVLHENHSTQQHEAIPKFEEWCSAIIGKAKLIPGDHQLLFVPFTCEVIVMLCNRSATANNRWEVDKLFSELMTELQGAGGVPSYVKKEVFKAFGVKEDHGHLKIGRTPRYCVNYQNFWGRLKYKRKLWQFRNEHAAGVIPALGRALPFWGMFGDYVPPYEESVKKSKDTTSGGK